MNLNKAYDENRDAEKDVCVDFIKILAFTLECASARERKYLPQPPPHQLDFFYKGGVFYLIPQAELMDHEEIIKFYTEQKKFLQAALNRGRE